MLEISFLFSTLLFLLFFYLGTGRNKRVLVVSIIWLIFISSLSLTGFFLNTITTPPRFLLVLVGNVIFVTLLYKKIKTINLRYVFLIHSLRIPVEMILFGLFIEKQLPKIMTFNGFNFDILIGISALVFFVIIQIFKQNISKKVLLIWNWVGIVFLSNIVVIAILSAPLPIQQLSFEQPNVAVLQYPFVFLPSFIVPVVFLTHFISIRQLRKR